MKVKYRTHRGDYTSLWGEGSHATGMGDTEESHVTTDKTHTGGKYIYTHTSMHTHTRARTMGGENAHRGLATRTYVRVTI